MKTLWKALRFILTIGTIAFIGHEIFTDFVKIKSDMDRITELPIIRVQILLTLAFGLFAIPTTLWGAGFMKRIDPKQRGFAGFQYWSFFRAMLYRYTPGRVLVLIERIRLQRKIGMSAFESTSILVYEQLLMNGMVLFLIGSGLLYLFQTDLLAQPLHILKIQLGSRNLGATVWSIFIIVLLGITSHFFWPRLPPRGVFRKIREFFTPVQHVGMMSYLLSSLVYAALWCSFSYAFGMLVGFGQELSIGMTVIICTGYLISHFGSGLVAVLPAGLGIREGLLIGLLALFDTELSAATIVILFRIQLTVAEIPYIIGAFRFTRSSITDAYEDILERGKDDPSEKDTPEDSPVPTTELAGQPS